MNFIVSRLLVSSILCIIVYTKWIELVESIDKSLGGGKGKGKGLQHKEEKVDTVESSFIAQVLASIVAIFALVAVNTDTNQLSKQPEGGEYL